MVLFLVESHNMRKEKEMKYQIIGDAGRTTETKTGKHVRELCVLDPNPPKGWQGLKATQLLLWDAALEVCSVETINGKFYDQNDNKNYYIDVDYSPRGWILGARVYNE